MKIISDSIPFPVGKGDRTIVTPYSFDKQVIAAHVALSGYDAQYTSEDHHVRQLKVMLSTTYSGFSAQVFANFNLRDRNADDDTMGSVHYVLFVELDEQPRPVIR